MTTKDYLKQIYRFDVLAVNAKLELEEVREQIGGLKAVTYDGDKVQSSSDGSPVESAYIKYEQKLRKAKLHYIRACDEYTQKRDDIICQINGLGDPVYSQLLYLRYAKYMDWLRISKAMDYDYNYLRSELHNKALAAFKIKYL